MEAIEIPALVRRLQLKRALLEAHDPLHEKIRTLLLVSGGGMRGAYGAGVCLALHHMNFANCFDTIVGVSIGAAIGAYFLAGKEQTKLGTNIYYEERRNGFIRYSFPLPTLRIDMLAEIFRSGRKHLNISSLARHRSEFFVGVTEWENGKNMLINAKLARPDPVAAITASLALPYAYPKPIIVNGEKYTDGGMSEPLPLKKAVQMFAPTDILVVSNYSHKESREVGSSLAEKIMDILAMSRLPSSLHGSFRKRDDSWTENVTYAEHCPCNTAILYGEESIGLLTKNLSKLRIATEKGIRDTLALFGDTSTPPEALMP